jgi:hypothetical protein
VIDASHADHVLRHSATLMLADKASDLMRGRSPPDLIVVPAA